MIPSWRGLHRAALAVLTVGAVALHGQTPAPAPAPAPIPSQLAQVPTSAASGKVTISAGRSSVLATDFEITRVAVTNPAVADATVVAPQEILLDGKSAGTVSLIVWGTDRRTQYDVVVTPAVSALQRQIEALFPGEDITANETPDAVILTGHASDNNVMLRAAEVAEAVAPKSRIINLLQLPGGLGSQQVLLQVRIAEVNRKAVMELGASIFTTAASEPIVQSSTQQYPSVQYDNLQQTYVDGKLASSDGQLTFSNLLNLFVFSPKYKLGTLIKALQQTGNLQSLAEPNLVAYNGQEASFLAGGELPIPVSTGTTGQVAVQYKEFGVRLTFKPTIAGDVIRLKVTPEVSSLDFANGVAIGGFRIPALIVRRVQTDVELRDGQSFAVAGLMNNSTQELRQRVPGLGSLPIIGYLFRSRAANKERTELLVLVTPHLVKALNPDEVPPLPTVPEKFLPPCDKPPCDGSDPKKKGSGG